jgi:hypothetical protein
LFDWDFVLLTKLKLLTIESVTSFGDMLSEVADQNTAVDTTVASKEPGSSNSQQTSPVSTALSSSSAPSVNENSKTIDNHGFNLEASVFVPTSFDINAPVFVPETGMYTTATHRISLSSYITLGIASYYAPESVVYGNPEDIYNPYAQNTIIYENDYGYNDYGYDQYSYEAAHPVYAQDNVDGVYNENQAQENLESEVGVEETPSMNGSVNGTYEGKSDRRGHGSNLSSGKTSPGRKQMKSKPSKSHIPAPTLADFVSTKLGGSTKAENGAELNSLAGPVNGHHVEVVKPLLERKESKRGLKKKESAVIKCIYGSACANKKCPYYHATEVGRI